jgi:hypothetical protein
MSYLEGWGFKQPEGSLGRLQETSISKITGAKWTARVAIVKQTHQVPVLPSAQEKNERKKMGEKEDTIQESQ